MHRSHLLLLSTIYLGAGLMLSACNRHHDHHHHESEASPDSKAGPGESQHVLNVPPHHEKSYALKTTEVRGLPADESAAGEVALVPSEAVVEWSHRMVAFVSQGQGKYELRMVTVGRQKGDSVTIVSGLKAGEKVVVAGQQRLQMLLQRQTSNFGGHGHPH